MFRIGPSYEIGGRRVAFEGQQFPIEAFDQFGKQGVPRWVTNDAATQNAYDALVQKVCPCIVLVHSQGGNFEFNAALKAPDKVKAVYSNRALRRARPRHGRRSEAEGRAGRI